MPRKTYIEQFKRDTVWLYELGAVPLTPGVMFNTVDFDLDVNRNSLRT